MSKHKEGCMTSLFSHGSMKHKMNGMRMGLGGVRPEMANHLGPEERERNV